MPYQTPYELPDFIHTENIIEVPENMKLFHFPGGFKFYSHSSKEETEFMYNEIFIKKEYMKSPLSIKKSQIIMDIGANIGLFTIFMKKINPKAVIYAFEPIKNTFNVFLKNIKLHKLENIIPHNIALGSFRKKRKILTFYPHMAGNSTSQPQLKRKLKKVMAKMIGEKQVEYFYKAEKQVVSTSSLSSIIDFYKITEIDFLKIDVEGDELEVLNGINNKHKKLIRQVALEVHSPELCTYVCSWLKKNNMQYLINRDIFGTDNMGAANIYAIKN